MNHCAHGGSITVQQIVDWQPFTSFTTRNETDDTGVVFISTTVFRPHEGGTNVTVYLSCEPEQAWPQVEATLRPTFERSKRRLVEILNARADRTSTLL
ncbi:MAG: hypothetical protein M3092_08385 [Actinomycetia bacterium]|nr:hypothetical protein [Actinomycetes bacterium]